MVKLSGILVAAALAGTIGLITYFASLDLKEILYLIIGALVAGIVLALTFAFKSDLEKLREKSPSTPALATHTITRSTWRAYFATLMGIVIGSICITVIVLSPPNLVADLARPITIAGEEIGRNSSLHGPNPPWGGARKSRARLRREERLQAHRAKFGHAGPKRPGP